LSFWKMASTASWPEANLVAISISSRPGGGLATQLAHQVAAGGAGEERADDVGVGDVGQLGALLRESLDVVPERLSRLLAATSKIPGVPRAHVHALEVAGEGLDQVVPVGDLPWRQMLQQA
jgi:hypothetical protein